MSSKTAGIQNMLVDYTQHKRRFESSLKKQNQNHIKLKLVVQLKNQKWSTQKCSSNVYTKQVLVVSQSSQILRFETSKFTSEKKHVYTLIQGGLVSVQFPLHNYMYNSPVSSLAATLGALNTNSLYVLLQYIHQMSEVWCPKHLSLPSDFVSKLLSLSSCALF